MGTHSGDLSTASTLEAAIGKKRCASDCYLSLANATAAATNKTGVSLHDVRDHAHFDEDEGGDCADTTVVPSNNDPLLRSCRHSAQSAIGKASSTATLPPSAVLQMKPKNYLADWFFRMFNHCKVDFN